MRFIRIAMMCGAAFAATAAEIGTAQARDADVCLSASGVDHTSVVSDTEILFHMKDGKIWKNTLQTACSGLRFEHAFSEDVRGSEICSNRQMIQVVHRETPCSLGTFTPYARKAPNTN